MTNGQAWDMHTIKSKYKIPKYKHYNYRNRLSQDRHSEAPSHVTLELAPSKPQL